MKNLIKASTVSLVAVTLLFVSVGSAMTGSVAQNEINGYTSIGKHSSSRQTVKVSPYLFNSGKEPKVAAQGFKEWQVTKKKSDLAKAKDKCERASERCVVSGQLSPNRCVVWWNGCVERAIRASKASK